MSLIHAVLFALWQTAEPIQHPAPEAGGLPWIYAIPAFVAMGGVIATIWTAYLARGVRHQKVFKEKDEIIAKKDEQIEKLNDRLVQMAEQRVTDFKEFLEE